MDWVLVRDTNLEFPPLSPVGGARTGAILPQSSWLWLQPCIYHPTDKAEILLVRGKLFLYSFQIWNVVMHGGALVISTLYSNAEFDANIPQLCLLFAVLALPCSAPFLDNGWQLKFCCGAEIMFCGEECRLPAAGTTLGLTCSQAYYSS